MKADRKLEWLDVHETDGKTAIDYVEIAKGKVAKAYISHGEIEAELHSGIVVKAKTPAELKRKLEEEE